MNARYWQKGETLDYTAAKEAVTNGQVVSLGGRIGVAGNDIAKAKPAPCMLPACLSWKRPPL